jgi:multidrug transporter EmrE-like cation transporter
MVLNAHQNVIIFVLFAINLLFMVLSNAGFKLSTQSGSLRGFITWQVVGNLAGFVTVLALTGLLHYIPLHVAFPVTTGLAVIGTQMLAGRLYFSEVISPVHWFGTIIIVIGIVFLTWR